MSALAVVEDGSVRELLQIAGDLVEWIDARIDCLTVGRDSVCLHVTSQADAELLARMLSLGIVTEHPDEDGARGFTVWSSGVWDGPRFSVTCAADVLVRPVRAFPPCGPWWLNLDDGTGAG